MNRDEEAVALPESVRCCIIGAGIQRLLTAYHLAKEAKAAGTGDGSDILVIDKSRIGAGASGIACGVVRNNYVQLEPFRYSSYAEGKLYPLRNSPYPRS